MLQRRPDKTRSVFHLFLTQNFHGKPKVQVVFEVQDFQRDECIVHYIHNGLKFFLKSHLNYYHDCFKKFQCLHCKYIQCNFYTFYMCPTFHCNLTLLFTFNCCSKYSGINVKLIYSFFYCNFYIGLYMANTCKVYTFYMCPVSTVISLYIFAVLFEEYLN